MLVIELTGYKDPWYCSPMGATEAGQARTFKTLEAAARAYGAEHGVVGKAGGWLYRNGRAFCQGWREYGFRLVDSGVIDPVDVAGNSVRRTVGEGFLGSRTVTIKPRRTWVNSFDLDHFVLISKEA